MDKNEDIIGRSADKDETVSSTVKASFTVCSTNYKISILANTQPVCIPSFVISKCVDMYRVYMYS